MQRALRDNIAARVRSMRETPEIAASTIVKIAGNACATGTFAIQSIDELRSRGPIATHRDG
jgi:hypothetical protein